MLREPDFDPDPPLPRSPFWRAALFVLAVSPLPAGLVWAVGRSAGWW